jgi:RNA methyltransferase, TrmH family
MQTVMEASKLIDEFQRAKRDTSLAIIEGVQALKHAVRFNAEIAKVITYDINYLEVLLDELASDVKRDILQISAEVSEETFSKCSSRPHRTKVVAIAQRRNYTFTDFNSDRPVIFLEEPKDLENIGAVIRVAAAADAGGVLISSEVDIWHPAVIRGAAGLHWALPVLNCKTADIFTLARPIIALDPTGTEKSLQVAGNILAFGTERHGLSRDLLTKADHIVRLPMKRGVSSLNLATSVAATLYRLW